MGFPDAKTIQPNIQGIIAMKYRLKEKLKAFDPRSAKSIK